MAKKPREKSSSGGVQSVEIGGQILAVVTDGGGAMALKDIAQAVAMPPAKVHRYLVSLIRAGLMEQDVATGKYDLGIMSLRAGLAAITRLNVVRAALPALAWLRDEVGETVHLAVWGERGPIVVHRELAPVPIAFDLTVGSPLSLLRTASGRVFLAWLDKKQTQSLLKEDMRRTGQQSKAQIDAIRETTRNEGFGRVAGDFTPSLAAISAPVFNHEDALVAVITTYGYEGSFDNSPTGITALLLKSAARDVSTKLGYDAPD